MRKLLLTLAVLCGTVSGWAQNAVYQKIPHTKWTVTSFNETPRQDNGREGGVEYIKDENPNTFYHSDWKSNYDGRNDNKGKDGKQGFLVEMAESFVIDKITYEGRSDGNSSGWATKVRIYVFENLPTDFPTNLSACTLTEKEDLLNRESNTVLGTPAFDNNETPWANDQNTKTAEFTTPQKGKYIFFVMDGGSDSWLTCSEFHAWQKIEGIEQDKPYYLKVAENAYIDVKTPHTSTSSKTIAVSEEPVCAYFTLNNGYWHISTESGHKGNFLGISQWDANPGQNSPANWTLHEDSEGKFYLAQATFYYNANNDPLKHYLGGDSFNAGDKLYTDHAVEKAVKFDFEAVPYAEVTFNYYDGETKLASANVLFDVNQVLNIGDVPAVDFYTPSSFKSTGDIVASNGANIDVLCTPAFPFTCATVDAQGNIEGPWYQMVQTGDNSNNKIALTEDGGRVNFVSDNINNNGLWAFVRVGGYKFKIYNRACPGVALTVANPPYDHYNHGKLYVNSEIEGLTTEFIISKNIDGFNIQIPGELIDNYYATAGNHIEGTFGFWSIADARPITAGGSRLSVTKVDNPDLTISKAALQNRINELNAMVALAGTNPGEYKVDEMAKLPEPIAVAQAVLDANSEIVAAYNNALTTLNEAIADVDFTMNPVVAGTYRIISAKPAFNGNKVMSAYGIHNNNPVYPAWTEKVDNDPLQYWVLEAAENGKFRMKAADGNYITSENSITETATEVSFVSIGSAQFNIKLGDKNKALHCNLHQYDYSAGPLIEYDGPVDSPSAWKIETVTELPKFTHELTVGNAGYATLMLGFNAEIPAGVTCYTVEVEGDKAMLAVVEGGVLAANTPVIVKSSDAGKYTFTATTASVTAPVANELKGTLYPKLITAAENTTYYVLSKPAAGEGEEENPVGFYQAKLNKNEGAAFLNNANKVYLPVGVEPAQAVRSLSFHFDEDATAIESIESVENNAVVYDLAGRRVQNAQKGVFIVNGKVIVK